MLFGVGHESVNLSVPVSRPLTNFKKAMEELKVHDTNCEAVTKADHFMKVMQAGPAGASTPPDICCLG